MHGCVQWIQSQLNEVIRNQYIQRDSFGSEEFHRSEETIGFEKSLGPKESVGSDVSVGSIEVVGFNKFNNSIEK